MHHSQETSWQKDDAMIILPGLRREAANDAVAIFSSRSIAWGHGRILQTVFNALLFLGASEVLDLPPTCSTCNTSYFRDVPTVLYSSLWRIRNAETIWYRSPSLILQKEQKEQRHYREGLFQCLLLFILVLTPQNASNLVTSPNLLKNLPPPG